MAQTNRQTDTQTDKQTNRHISLALVELLLSQLKIELRNEALKQTADVDHFALCRSYVLMDCMQCF